MGGTLFALSIPFPQFRPDIVSTDDKLSLLATGLALGIMVGFFEELGWSGFGLPELRRRHGVVGTGLVMGLLWGTWHLPMFAGTRDPQGVVPAVVVVAALLFTWLPPYRVLMVWVYDRTQSLLMAMLMHVPISMTTYVLASEAGSATELLTPVLLWGAAFWMIVAVAAWASGGQLTPGHEVAATPSGGAEAHRS